jgi:hypothetical protein
MHYFPTNPTISQEQKGEHNDQYRGVNSSISERINKQDLSSLQAWRKV